MRQSGDELITFFQSDLMLDFGFDDDYVIQSLVLSMQELRRMKLDRPAPPRPGDAEEKPTKPFGCFEPPSVERLIASMHVETAGGEFMGRPSIPADGGPVIVPEALLKRNASDWSFVGRDNDEVSSTHASVAGTDAPSSRTSLVSSMLDNIGNLPEPVVVSFVAAESALRNGMMTTGPSTDPDQKSNSEYDNVPRNGADELSSLYEQEVEQTLESIEQEIQELLGTHSEISSPEVMHNGLLCSPAVIAPTDAQNHVLGISDHHSAHIESSADLDSVPMMNRSLTSELHSSVPQQAAVSSPSMSAASVTYSPPPVLSWPDSNSLQNTDCSDLVVIPIQHLPSAAPYRPPIKPKPQNVPVSPYARSSSASALTPIPVLHLRTVPMAQFSVMSRSLSATQRPLPTSSANGC